MRARIVFLALALGGILGRIPALDRQTRPKGGEVVVEVGGDVLPESSWLAAEDPDHLLDKVRDEFRHADLTFVNFEEPLTSSAHETPYKSPAAVRSERDFVLRAQNPRIPNALKESGVGLVGLANNHTMDYTAEGLRDTLDAFRFAGLPTVGAGLEADAARAYVFEKDGIRIALLAFSDVIPTHCEATPARPGIASARDERRLVTAIQAARRSSDFVILMIHWGRQGNHLITRRQRELAQVAAEAGCDVVVGMHPHVMQGAEYFGRVPVLYSIGNFVFPSRNPAARECVLARLRFGPQQLAAVELIPVEISPQGLPAIASDGHGDNILSHLDGFCRMFNAEVKEGKLKGAAPREGVQYDPGEGSKEHRVCPQDRFQRRARTESPIGTDNRLEQRPEKNLD